MNRECLWKKTQIEKKSSESKVKFRQASNHCKRVLEAAKLTYTNKAREFIISKKLGPNRFQKIADIVLNKSKSCRSQAKTGISGISVPVFPSRSDLKLHNIPVTPKIVRKVVTSLDTSKAPSPDCIQVVILKNCEPELSYILAELSNKCLKGSCFPDCWNVSLLVLVFKNVGERSSRKIFWQFYLI